MQPPYAHTMRNLFQVRSRQPKPKLPHALETYVRPSMDI